MVPNMEDKPKIKVIELLLEKFDGDWSPEKKPIQTIVIQYDPNEKEDS